MNQKKGGFEKDRTLDSGSATRRTAEEPPFTLGMISTRLINWAKTVELNTQQKREFIEIIRDFGLLIAWAKKGYPGNI